MTIEGLTSLPGDLYAAFAASDRTNQEVGVFRTSVAVRITSLAMAIFATGVTLVTSVIPVIGSITLLGGIATGCFAHDLFACGTAMKTRRKPEFLVFEALHATDIALPVITTLIHCIAALVLPSAPVHENGRVHR